MILYHVLLCVFFKIMFYLSFKSSCGLDWTPLGFMFDTRGPTLFQPKLKLLHYTYFLKAYLSVLRKIVMKVSLLKITKVAFYFINIICKYSFFTHI